ncbi:tol-pal system protein YbgF [Vibrio palustris]|uniref:Cell division coordinator CpoB n=1 Tax=Vibrio palustris TaxID=1918946 RepID=A0A1R4B1Y2_9VIBR|nr:tol-pal system protein YbgF [Vibrio palustris]SJL82920.1 tol-pal system protein YbgF [Vibrio palustris]
MFSNLKQVVMLTLLASAASSTLAAPAPVSDIDYSSNQNNGQASASQANGSQDSEIQRLERLVKSRSRMQLKMQQQMDEMSQEIRSLRGKLEKNSYNMQQMTKRQRELFVELDDLRSHLKKNTATGTAQQDASSDDDQGTFSSNKDERSAYQDAVDLILKKHDYDGAIQAFEKFQKEFPDSVYTPNSHYWLGQLFFAKKDDVKAAKNFAKVATFKKSNKRADALVKLGDIASRNNQADQAKKYYQQVVDDYPDSSSAEVAKPHLK